jgi:hypothetical protein
MVGIMMEHSVMEMHSLNEANSKASVIRDSRSVLRRMTREQLLHLGMSQVVYLKSGMCDGRMLFVLFGADGTPVAVAHNLDAAVQTTVEQGLNFVAVH